jgi:hypothetical protein
MAEIYLNKNDIRSIIESYKTLDTSFVMREYIDNGNKKICIFYLKGKECKAEFYIKKNSLKIIPVGKNVEECNILIDYVSSKGLEANIENRQFTFSCSQEVINSLIDYINEECNGIVSYTQNNNIYKISGYNGDELTFTYYSTTNRALIQGKPLHVYSVITTFLSGLTSFTFDQIVEINNAFAGMNTPSSVIRMEMQNKLGEAYLYLDEALLKSISGSLSLLKQKPASEDYTGCITGEFKALEGYLKKILTKKYSYKLRKHDTFSMFYREYQTLSEIEQNINISPVCKEQLNKLYNMYTNKRNVYLHSTIDPSQTRIIESLKEAQDLSDEILKAIRDSYCIIFN